MVRMPKVELTGTPYERGQTHGTKFECEIQNNVENYLELFEYYGATESEIYDQVDRFIDIIDRENENYMAEMQGIADGSDLSLEDITVLNSRYELVYVAWKEEADATSKNTEPNAIKVDGCTTFGATSTGTSTNDTYLAESWGWKPWINVCLMDIKRDDRPDMITMTETGIVGGKIGINEHGIGIGLNGLGTEKDGENIFRKPYHVRFREMLDESTLDKSIASLITQDRACSANLIIGQPEVGIVDIEAGPEKVNYLYPNDGVISHANHIKGDNLDSELEKIFPDSITRGMRIRKLLSQMSGSIDTDRAKEMLRDEACSPSSICREVDESIPKEEQVKTMGSFVMNLSDREIHVANGRPTENEYHKHELNAS